jgi:hypothetical protein
MPQLLKEYHLVALSEQQLNEAVSLKPGQPLVFRRILLQRADAKNRNGRIYPKSVLEPVIAQYNEEFVKTRRALGALDHENNMVLELKTASHLITEMHWEGNELYGDVEILDTPFGLILKELALKRIPFGISSRANGSVEETNEAIIVQDDLQLLCFDAVSYESTVGSTLALHEGFNPNINKYEKVDELMYNIICANSTICECKITSR